MPISNPVFAKTVIRVEPSQSIAGGKHSYIVFKIYGVEQARHVWDPIRLVPRNDNAH